MKSVIIVVVFILVSGCKKEEIAGTCAVHGEELEYHWVDEPDDPHLVTQSPAYLKAMAKQFPYLGKVVDHEQPELGGPVRFRIETCAKCQAACSKWKKTNQASYRPDDGDEP